MVQIDAFVFFTARMFIAVLLIVAGVKKALTMGRFQVSVKVFLHAPERIARLISFSVVSLELCLGFALIGSAEESQACFIASLLFFLYMVIIGVQITKGWPIQDCGCALLGNSTAPSAFHLLRNAALACLAAAGLMRHSGRHLDELDKFQIGAAVFCMLVLYVCAEAIERNKSAVDSVAR